MDTQSEIYDLLEPIVKTADVELVDVEWTGGTLRVTIEQPGGVTTAKIVEINRLVSPVLDQHDPISSRYVLEVSSPGVERPLNRPKHYQQAIGEQVLVKLVGQGAAATDKTSIRRVKGTLVSVEEEAIIVAATNIDGVETAAEVEHRIEIDKISKARTVFDWGTKEKPGKGPKKSSKKSNSSKLRTVKSEPVKSEPVKSKPVKSKPVKSTSGSQPNQSKPAKPRSDTQPSAKPPASIKIETTTEEVHNGK